MMPVIVYTAPNRAHHYGYARDLAKAGMLKAFVSGFSRFSPRAGLPEIGPALKRADYTQTLYVASCKIGLPRMVCDEMAYLAKLQLDAACSSQLDGANAFLFYNGCGLSSARKFRKQGGITIVEAVNSHVLTQQTLLADEHRQLGLPWRPFHLRETKRRVEEVEEADYILLPSHFVKRSFMAQGIPEHRLLHVPYPIQSIPGGTRTEVGVVSKSSGNIFRVLYVGTISVRKGLRYLVQAFEKLKHPCKELWIVGPRTEPSGIDDLRIPPSVEFKGVLKGAALQEAYRQASVFCLPSIEEGLALVLSEALSFGVPIIATENTGIEDLSGDSSAGVATPIRDAGAIAAALQRFADDREFMLQARNAAKVVAARFQNRENCGSRLVSCLQSLPTKQRIPR